MTLTALSLTTASHGFAATLFVALVVGAALEVLTGSLLGNGGTLAGITMQGNDSLSVRSTQSARNIRLLGMWARTQSAQVARVRSPRMHDNTQGIRNRVKASQTGLLMPLGWSQPLYSLDTLIAELSGSSSSTGLDTLSLLLYYDDVPGASAQFIDAATLKARGKNLMSVETAHAVGSAGGYTGSVAINSSMDMGKNDSMYALVGYRVNVDGVTVGWKGIDTGNLRVGGPADASLPHLTDEWFKRLSDEFALPLIPVFKWANKGSITADAVQDQSGTAITLTSHFVELG